MSQELWFILFFLLVTVPAFLGAVALLDGTTGEWDGNSLEEPND
ncbi:hypothetical protein [Halopelagius fulvigenes]|uniref:Uncharacterized protein n=1 Tax=Halopelagius fulvigenes TaxID=1198324 RepID=A0ABD5U272_9EURY